MDEQSINNEYQTGFNEGYIIAKYLPELADQLRQVKSESLHMNGFRDGRNEFIHERAKEHAPQWLKKDLLPKADTTNLPAKNKNDKDLDKE